MRRKHFVPCDEPGFWGRGPRGRGHGRRGRGWRPAAGQAWEPGPGYGWRRWADAGPMAARAWPEELPEEAPTWGPPPWARGRGLEMEAVPSKETRQAWLEARLARLRAWKDHLEARLAETEEALAAMKIE